jgi:4-amino-4-deoxy-L-arabinose transferase-like glycosyltransferase
MPRMRDRKQRLLVLWLVATTLACFDLWLNMFLPSPDWALHHRSALWAIGCMLVLAAVVPLTRVRSNAVTVGAGVFAGGVLGNLISGASDHLVVPNPLLLSLGNGGIAFNLADTFILTGNLILMVSLCAFAVRNREQLRARRLVSTRRGDSRRSSST